MQVKKLWTHSSRPLLDIGEDLSTFAHQILTEDIPAVVFLDEERQEDPVWERRKRYKWFGREENVQVGTVPKKRVRLTIEYNEPRDIENAWHDFRKICTLRPQLHFWNPEILLDKMNVLTNGWYISSRADSNKKITDPQPLDSMTATIILLGLVDSDKMRNDLMSLECEINEPTKQGRHSYTTTYGSRQHRGYPPLLALVKSWEGFDEDRPVDFFRRIQEISREYYLRDKWIKGYFERDMMALDDTSSLARYRIDIPRKVCVVEKLPSDRGGYPDYPMLEVAANIWCNSTHEDGARCFFMLKSAGLMTMYS